MPKPELQELIELYEVEKANIEALIKELLDEMEYKMAARQQRGLQKVHQMLNVLHHFNDPVYETKASLERYKALLEKLNTASADKNYYDGRLEEINLRLKNLPGGKTTERPSGQEFDDAIFDVIERKKKGFRLYLKKEVNFWTDFRMANETTLLIATTPIKEITEEYFFNKYHRRAFKGLGFILSKETGSLEYKYSVINFKTAEFLKVLIGRIIFDILYFNELDKLSFIEYHP